MPRPTLYFILLYCYRCVCLGCGGQEIYGLFEWVLGYKSWSLSPPTDGHPHKPGVEASSHFESFSF